MLKFFYTGLIILSAYTSVRAQGEMKVKYIYTETTDDSQAELFKLTKGDDEKRILALEKQKQFEKEGKIILSSKEYAPIRAKINKPVTDAESKKIAAKFKNNYIVVTDLLK